MTALNINEFVMKQKEVLSNLGLYDNCLVFMRDDTLYGQERIVNLRPVRGKDWVMLISVFYFESNSTEYLQPKNPITAIVSIPNIS